MALPDSTSLAPVVATSVRNVQFRAAAENLPRKIGLIGTYLPAMTAVVPEVPVQILSPNDAGYKFGFGSMLHRLAIAAAKKGGQIETWCIPQEEITAGVKASGSIVVSVTTAAAGTLALYFSGVDLVSVPVVVGDTPTSIGDKIVAAMAAVPELGAVGVNTAGSVAVTSAGKGTYGNGTTIEANLGGETLPGGVSLVITQMTSGATDPDVGDALTGMGIGDNQNELGFTDIVCGYAPITATLDDISEYNGVGDEKAGNFAPTVGRPFRCLFGHKVAGSAGFTAAAVISDARLTDRTNGLIAAPDSKSHPAEIAAEVMGEMAALNQADPAKGYVGRPLSIETGDNGERWTDDYATRDAAVKRGISTTRLKNGVVTIDKVVSFYRPTGVPVTSNGYRSMRNMSILQNLLHNLNLTFEAADWKGITIVEDVAAVTDATAKQNVRDLDSVRNVLNTLAETFAAKSWLYSASYTKQNLSVSLRPGGNGFDYVFPVVLSGEGDIMNGEVQFDIALTVFTA